MKGVLITTASCPLQELLAMLTPDAFSERPYFIDTQLSFLVYRLAHKEE